jgi:Ca-activated chloride channel homolog
MLSFTSAPPVRWLAAVIISSVLTLATGNSQARAQEPSSDDDVVRVTTDLLVFPVRVKDKSGRAVSGLTEKDVSLKDDAHVTKSFSFSGGADSVALVFALDQSGSLRETISQQRDAALALFTKFGERSHVAVLRFADSPQLVAPFDQDAETARRAFDFAAATNSHTAIFDAAAQAIKEFDALPFKRTERRIVILISDGLDNASRTKPAAIMEAALEKRVSFYVIHLPLFEPRDGRLSVRPPSKGFRELAEHTGGKYFLAAGRGSALSNEKYDLTPIFDAIEEDLKSQYLLSFYLNETARDGRQHVFLVSMVPDIKYSVGRLSYSRTQKFFVNLPSKPTQQP